MRYLLHERIKRYGSNHRDIHSGQFNKLFLWIGDGRWNLIFRSQKFLVYCFKAINYIETVTRIIKIARARIMTPRGVDTNKGLTGREQGRGMRTAVDGFINAGDIYSLMGWGTRTTMVVWQWMETRIKSKIINAKNIHGLIRQGW